MDMSKGVKKGTHCYLVGDRGLPSGRGLVQGCQACVVVPEEDDPYSGSVPPALPQGRDQLRALHPVMTHTGRHLVGQYYLEMTKLLISTVFCSI